eukprot:TRINITY_DN4500_c0_g1_i1.p1 TRINITY_DN4500_c0_g1~~TRINITY_DN4500_c0_g1_i1.p1  ORF type:complete len:376 (-),score=116.74 TRINITY_DN4500_c0_g1_i1:326-1453(-)
MTPSRAVSVFSPVPLSVSRLFTSSRFLPGRLVSATATRKGKPKIPPWEKDLIPDPTLPNVFETNYKNRWTRQLELHHKIYKKVYGLEDATAPAAAAASDHATPTPTPGAASELTTVKDSEDLFKADKSFEELMEEEKKKQPAALPVYINPNAPRLLLHPRKEWQLAQRRYPEFDPRNPYKRDPNDPTRMLPRRKPRKRAREEAIAVLRRLRTSQHRLNTVLNLIRARSFDDALAQLKMSEKRIARAVIPVLLAARSNATNRHPASDILDATRLYVKEAWVGRMTPIKKIRYHSRGRAGRAESQMSMLTIVLRELPEDEFVGRFGVNGRSSRKWPLSPANAKKLPDEIIAWREHVAKHKERIEALMMAGWNSAARL